MLFVREVRAYRGQVGLREDFTTYFGIGEKIKLD